MSSTAGRLLVAPPALVEPTFAQTVVLVLDHDAGGALGVVLNRPSPLPVADVLPGWEHVCAPPAVLALGGPVGRQGAVCVAEPPRAVLPGLATGAVRPTPGGHALVDLDASPDVVGEARVRIFVGHAGWAPGQLDDELAADGWLVVDAAPGDLLAPEPQELWRRVLSRQAGPLAALSTWTPRPEDN